MGGENSQLVRRTQRNAQRGSHDGVPEDCTRSGDVWRQLFPDPEQEEDTAVAGRGRARVERLRI